MFHLFQNVCCKRFDLNVAYVSQMCCNNMFQMFYLFQSFIAASGFMLQVQVFYMDVAYVFTHMLQAYVPDVSLVSVVCCIQVFHVARVSCCLERQRAQGSHGGATLAPGNGARQAGGWQTWHAAC
jgi:hypothetical protein